MMYEMQAKKLYFGLAKTWEEKWGKHEALPPGPGGGDLLKAKFGNVNRYAAIPKMKDAEEESKETEEKENEKD